MQSQYAVAKYVSYGKKNLPLSNCHIETPRALLRFVLLCYCLCIVIVMVLPLYCYYA